MPFPRFEKFVAFAMSALRLLKQVTTKRSTTSLQVHDNYYISFLDIIETRIIQVTHEVY